MEEFALYIPQFYGVVKTPRRDRMAIGTETDTGDGSGMTLESIEEFALYRTHLGSFPSSSYNNDLRSLSRRVTTPL
jgi:hypothetical protein